MNKLSLRDERTAQTVELARRAFEAHQIIERTESNWLIRRVLEDGNLSTSYWTEVAVLRKSLYVGGDIVPVLFEGGPGPAIERVRWLGETDDLTYYVAQKARMGLRSESAVWAWDAAVAHDALKRYVREVRRDGPGEVGDRDSLAQALIADDRAAFIERAGQAFRTVDARTGLFVVDHEPFYDMGKILDARVIYAHAALQRLWALLLQEKSAKPGEVADV